MRGQGRPDLGRGDETWGGGRREMQKPLTAVCVMARAAGRSRRGKGGVEGMMERPGVRARRLGRLRHGRGAGMQTGGRMTRMQMLRRGSSVGKLHVSEAMKMWNGVSLMVVTVMVQIGMMTGGRSGTKNGRRGAGTRVLRSINRKRCG